jgi:hypothetical protein
MTAVVQEKPVMEFTTLTEVNDLPILEPVRTKAGDECLMQRGKFPAASRIQNLNEDQFSGWTLNGKLYSPDNVPDSCWDDGWEAMRKGNELLRSSTTVWSVTRGWWLQKRGRLSMDERETRAKVLSVLFWLLDWARERSFTGAFLYDPGEVDNAQWRAMLGRQQKFIDLLRTSNKFIGRNEVNAAFKTLYQVFYPQFDEFFHTANYVLQGEEPPPYHGPRSSITVKPTPLDQPQIDYFDFIVAQIVSES